MSVERFSARQGRTSAADPRQAVADLHQQVHQPEAKALVFFASPRYNLEQLGRELAARFDYPLIGCTTAGEIISRDGYTEGGLVGVTLASDELFVHTGLIAPLAAFEGAEVLRFAERMKAGLRSGESLERKQLFGLLLIDGLSMLEEQVTGSLFNQFGDIPLIGGSAGDGLRFQETYVFHDGRFISNAARFTLFETTLPFETFRFQHFVPTERRLVITESEGATRTVSEIDGLPAAEAFARAVGVEVKDLNPDVFAAYPLLLRIGDQYFVRSIQKLNPDGSLTFFCAIDTGLVLTLGQGAGLIESLRRNLEDLGQKRPDAKLLLGCDCVLRRLELQQKGLMTQAEEILRSVNFVGFSTYGEQFNGVHVNQTLTGVAIGG